MAILHKMTNMEAIEHLLKIKDKRGQIVPFKRNIAQAYYMERKTLRNLIVKARQKGVSKIIQADQLIDCIRKPTNAVLISHEKEATKRMFEAVRFYIDKMKKKPSISIESKSEIRFPKRGSYFFIGTAGQKAFGRGDTLQRAHLSEAAFYPDLERILAGVEEACEYGQIDIETTTNGRDALYDLWKKAKSGRSSYTPIFIPWFIGDEYSVDKMTEAEKRGRSQAVQELFDTPDEALMLTKEEKDLIAMAEREHKAIITKGMIKWRRYKIWDKGDLFFQEYPEDDVSCFLQTGRTVFGNVTTEPHRRIPMDDLNSWMITEANGTVRKATADDIALLKKRYFYAGVDGAEGTLKGDSHVLAIGYVADDGKFVFCFEIASNKPIDEFWALIAPILKQYKITLGIEKNGVGVAHVEKAKQHRVSYEPWETNATTRPIMLTSLEEGYRKEEVIETYPEAEDEARDMIYDAQNRPDHKPNGHDDRVFARTIAYQMRLRPVPRITLV